MYQVVLSNCPDTKTAERIAHRLIADRLAACVNIMPNVSSVYSWQNEIQQDTEVMLIIKSKKSQFVQLESLITELHPYEVVEVIALDIQQGNEPYLNWINNMVKNN
ncbi:divalent-cation tolerance protein CutA [Colwelliaceae bacterium BS250]